MPPPPAVMSSDRAARGRRVAELVRASGAHLGAVIDPGGEHLTLVDDEGTVLSDNQALLLLLDMVVVDESGTPRWRCPVVDADGGRAASAPRPGPRSSGPSCRPPHLMEVASTGGVTFAASQMGGFIFPRFLPAFDAVATLVHLLGHAGAHRRAAVEAGAPACRRPHRPRGGRHAVGAEGHRDAHDWWSGPRDATSSWSTA